MEVAVYRSGKKADTYLLVPEANGLDGVPEALLAQFGEATLSFTFTLTEARSLQRIEPDVLKAQLLNQGFYLQLPPPEQI